MHFKCGSCSKIMSLWQMCLPLMSTVDIVNQSFQVWSVTKGLKKGLKWNKRSKCQLIIAQNWASNGSNLKHTEISQLRSTERTHFRVKNFYAKILRTRVRKPANKKNRELRVDTVQMKWCRVVFRSSSQNTWFKLAKWLN